MEKADLKCNYHIWNTYHVPGIVLISLHTLFALIFQTLRYKLSSSRYSEETVCNVETFIEKLSFSLNFAKFARGKTRLQA